MNNGVTPIPELLDDPKWHPIIRGWPGLESGCGAQEALGKLAISNPPGGGSEYYLAGAPESFPGAIAQEAKW